VTASNAWPNFYLRDGREVDKQVAVPPETRTPNLHRLKRELPTCTGLLCWRLYKAHFETLDSGYFVSHGSLGRRSNGLAFCSGKSLFPLIKSVRRNQATPITRN